MKIRKNLLPFLGLLVVHSTGMYAEVDVDEQRAPRPEPALPIPDPLCNQATCDFGNPLLVAGDLYVDNIFLPNSDATPRGNIYKGGQLFIHNYGGSTFLGVNAGNANVTTGCNIGIGPNAADALTTATNVIAIGCDAAGAMSTGNQIIAIGTNAYQAGTGSQNLVIGHLSAPGAVTGSDNTILGHESATALTTGFGNLMIGHSSGINLQTGDSNLYIGRFAGQVHVASDNVIALGNNAHSNGEGGSDIAIGNLAMGTGLKTLGVNLNIAIGHGAGLSLTSGVNNILVGSYVSPNFPAISTGSNNIVIGTQAARSLNTSDNVLISNALSAAVALGTATGTRNVVIGAPNAGATFNPQDAVIVGAANVPSMTGLRNVVLGSVNLPNVTTGDDNVFIGNTNTANLNTSGTSIIIGRGSAASMATSDRVIVIGSGNFNSAAILGRTDVIMLGNNIDPAVVPGGGATFISYIRGTTTNIADAVPVLIDSAGQLGTTSSSRRVKHDIKNLNKDVVDRLLQLRAVEFKYIPERDASQRLQYGMIAEEVYEIMPEIVVRDKDGEIETVQYHILPSLLVAALQHVNAEKDELKERVQHLEALVGALVKTHDARLA